LTNDVVDFGCKGKCLFIPGANLEGEMFYIILNDRLHEKNTIYVI